MYHLPKGEKTTNGVFFFKYSFDTSVNYATDTLY